MKREIFHLWPEMEREYGFSQAYRVGDMLWIAGTVAFDDKGEIVGKGDIGAQARQAYANIRRTLAHFGATMQNVVEETIYLLDMDRVDAVIAARHEAYGHPEPPPCAGIGVARLQLPELLIEIKCSARLE